MTKGLCIIGIMCLSIKDFCINYVPTVQGHYFGTTVILPTEWGYFSFILLTTEVIEMTWKQLFMLTAYPTLTIASPLLASLVQSPNLSPLFLIFMVAPHISSDRSSNASPIKHSNWKKECY